MNFYNMFKLQNEFPNIELFKKHFPVTDRTIFAWDDIIYCNYDLPPHLIIHEQEHLKQQKEYGLKVWLKKYIEDKEFRLKMELKAYRKQLNSIKDREKKNRVRIQVSRDLGSALYDNIISFQEAFDKLR